MVAHPAKNRQNGAWGAVLGLVLAG